MFNNFYKACFISVLFVSGSISSQAAIVSVSAEFTYFQLGQIYSYDHAMEAGLSINGSDVYFDLDLFPYRPAVFPISGNEVTFGYQSSFGAIQNSFKFEGSTEIEVSGTGSDHPFLLGSLSFTNGQFYPLAFLAVELTTHSSDPLYDNHKLNMEINFVSNNPDLPYTPEQQADYFYISGTPELGSVRVYDSFACPTIDACGSGSVDLYGFVNSLHLAHFADPSEGVFISSSIEPWLPLPVPEPETYAMLLAGLGLLGFFARNRKQAA